MRHLMLAVFLLGALTVPGLAQDPGEEPDHGVARLSLISGDVTVRRGDSGEDIAALRRFVGLTQAAFARAMGISVHTLRNWEQGRRQPEGPAVALLRIAARHPRIIRENLRSAA